MKQCIANNDIDTITTFLDENTDILKCFDSDGTNLMLYAISLKNEHIVKILAHYGCKFNAEAYLAHSPLRLVNDFFPGTELADLIFELTNNELMGKNGLDHEAPTKKEEMRENGMEHEMDFCTFVPCVPDDAMQLLALGNVSVNEDVKVIAESSNCEITNN